MQTKSVSGPPAHSVFTILRPSCPSKLHNPGDSIRKLETSESLLRIRRIPSSLPETRRRGSVCGAALELLVWLSPLLSQRSSSVSSDSYIPIRRRWRAQPPEVSRLRQVRRCRSEEHTSELQSR